MKFSTTTASSTEVKANWLVAGISENDEFSPSLQRLDEALDGSLSRMREREDLTGKAGEVTVLGDAPGLAADRLLIVGLGTGGQTVASRITKSLFHSDS